jgi:hypothetical protein
MFAGMLGLGYRRLLPAQPINSRGGAVADRIDGDASRDVVATGGLSPDHKAITTPQRVDKLVAEADDNNSEVGNDLGRR